MTTGESNALAHSDDSHGEELGHAVPLRILVGVFAALVLLTVATVAASQFPTGSFEIWIALGIALVKSTLVGAYFMHLRYDNPLYALIFAFGLLFVALFIGLALMDTAEYQHQLIPMTNPTAPPG